MLHHIFTHTDTSHTLPHCCTHTVALLHIYCCTLHHFCTRLALGTTLSLRTTAFCSGEYFAFPAACRMICMIRISSSRMQQSLTTDTTDMSVASGSIHVQGNRLHHIYSSLQTLSDLLFRLQIYGLVSFTPTLGLVTFTPTLGLVTFTPTLGLVTFTPTLGIKEGAQYTQQDDGGLRCRDNLQSHAPKQQHLSQVSTVGMRTATLRAATDASPAALHFSLYLILLIRFPQVDQEEFHPKKFFSTCIT